MKNDLLKKTGLYFSILLRLSLAARFAKRLILRAAVFLCRMPFFLACPILTLP